MTTISSASTAATTSSTDVHYGRAFWEHFWRTAGLQYVIFFIITSGLNDFSWALVVLSSFPRAMLLMSRAFGLWRAKLISNALFAAGVAAVVLGVLGGSTWLSGVWAPDGLVSRFVMPILLLLWVLAVSRVLLSRSPATRAAW